jgi:RNA polymerase primary sigma factor
MMRADLDRLLDSKLSERESSVLRMRYGLRDGKPRTLADIGQLMSVTRERIRQIETRALQKLRSPANAEMLKEYMESELMNME